MKFTFLSVSLLMLDLIIIKMRKPIMVQRLRCYIQNIWGQKWSRLTRHFLLQLLMDNQPLRRISCTQLTVLTFKWTQEKRKIKSRYFVSKAIVFLSRPTKNTLLGHHPASPRISSHLLMASNLKNLLLILLLLRR